MDSPSNDISTLITVLISELRTTLNTRIDILNEKINLKNEENETLKKEVHKLKQVITNQEKTIADLTQKQHCQQTVTAASPATSPGLSGTIQTEQKTAKRLRGIKAHNLIITCPKNNDKDPKQQVEDIFVTHFHRKPSINGVQVMNTRGSPSSSEINTRRQSDSQGATSEHNENYKLICTLNSVWEANAIYRDRVQALRNTGIFISEDLNKEEAYLFYIARQLKKKKVILNTWTVNGDVFIKENITSLPIILQANNPILNNMKEAPENVKEQETAERSPQKTKNKQSRQMEKEQVKPESSYEDISQTRSDTSLNKVKQKEIFKRTTRQKKQNEQN
jgi:hypothetical protein